MNIKGKKIIVTGGAGFIGSHIVDALVKEGARVFVIDDLSSGKNNISHLKNKVKHIKISITDLESLKKVFKGAYAVVHHAAIASVRKTIKHPKQTHEVNALGTLQIFIAAVEAKVDRVIYASSSAVYGDSPKFPKVENMQPDPISPYAIQKLIGELYGLFFYNIYGLKTIGLRYFNVFGPRQDSNSEYSAVIPKFIGLIKDQKNPHIYGDGKQTRDFVYVDDVVRANLNALKTNKGFGQVYNIGTGKQISLNKLVDCINEILGTNLQAERVQSKAGEIKHSHANIKKAKQHLNWTPKTSFEKGLLKTIKSL